MLATGVKFLQKYPSQQWANTAGEYLAFVGLLLPHAMVILKDYRLFFLGSFLFE